jgi:hypothetical protein
VQVVCGPFFGLSMGLRRSEGDIPQHDSQRNAAMNRARVGLFRTVPEKDHLGFWTAPTFKAEQVVDSLEFTNVDVVKIAAVALASIRSDQKIPPTVSVSI